MWHIAQSAGNWDRETAAPGSDARLGDGGSLSAIVGHAHGAQIPEAQFTIRGSFLATLLNLAAAHFRGNSRARVFLRPHLRK
jgi:hypothetical protein